MAISTQLFIAFHKVRFLYLLHVIKRKGEIIFRREVLYFIILDGLVPNVQWNEMIR